MGCLALFTLLALLGAQVATLALWASGASMPLWVVPAPIVAAGLLLVTLSAVGAWRRRRWDTAVGRR